MIKSLKLSFLVIIFISLLTGCSNSQKRINKIFQTNSATKVKNDYEEVIKSLVTFKQKLNVRNPQNYDKKLSYSINADINSLQDNIKLKVNNKYITLYSDYLKHAFNKSTKVNNRNDYLILGIYKLVYEAYDIKKGHQITALSYDVKKLQKLYYNLNSLKWRIKSFKDDDNNYLFLTWQKNWQIELQREINDGKKPSWKMIKNLKYIKQNKESIFESSNFSFEILLSKMIYNVKNTLKNVGEEPIDVGIEAMKSFILFI